MTRNDGGHGAAAASTTTPVGLVPITVNDLRRLFHALIIEPPGASATSSPVLVRPLEY
ncbi:hypothetical protein O3597_12785 [Verrucosispora sp. WMMA2044]|uniref:Uncharacterized protein n=1 Tax=Verrucosispora sioxanthis TaxID=2499994 RepID=A0A6M1L5X7_9ACTN|nr:MULTISPECIES: hypothetical protein [Micromonospora]NEE64214.1 hypothetical protein [Verrucosispora sioxanthis]NGM13324.1 hypothetical protein [Verrucosispora sioxanthis]WBB51281.1 hypothetical protein O3597_12785 [Verrucosispora sp. WMMA2044]